MIDPRLAQLAYDKRELLANAIASGIDHERIEQLRQEVQGYEKQVNEFKRRRHLAKIISSNRFKRY